MQPIDIPSSRTAFVHSGSVGSFGSAGSGRSFGIPSQATSITSRLESLLLSLQLDEELSPGMNGGGMEQIPYGRKDSVDTVVSARTSAEPGDNTLASSPLAHLTLDQIQTGSATISGFLQKLNANPLDIDNLDQWKQRYFVLCEDGNLFLFKSSANPKAMPVTFLPVSSCTALFDSETGHPLLRVQGQGTTTSGMPVKRNWTLRCPDEQSMALWHRSITRIVGFGQTSEINHHTHPFSANRMSRSSSVGSKTRYSRVSTVSFSHTFHDTPASPTSPVSPQAGAVGTGDGFFESGVGRRMSTSTTASKISVSMMTLLARSNSSTSSTVNLEEREAAQRQRYQEYLNNQKLLAERVQKEQQELAVQKLKLEQEQREQARRLELEQAEREKKEREKAEVERKKAEVERKRKLLAAKRKQEEEVKQEMAMWGFSGRF